MEEAKDLELTDDSGEMAANGYPVTTEVTYELVLHIHAL